MPSKSLIDRLNEQINLEFFSSNMYLQMSAWCEQHSLKGCASFFGRHAGEEMDHMRKLFAYVNERGQLARIGAIDAPPTEYKSIQDVFEKTLEHEKLVTSKIHALVEQAMAEKDYTTFNFLQWFVAEQHEEETLFQDLLDRVKLLSGDARGLAFIDREVATAGA